MSLVRLVAAEAHKAATLPAVWVGLAVAVLGAPAITLLNAFNVRNAVESGRLELIAHTSPVEAAFAAVPLGTVGAVVLGVVVVSSEYTANRDDAGGEPADHCDPHGGPGPSACSRGQGPGHRPAGLGLHRGDAPDQPGPGTDRHR
ncbi:hypothetical protein [Nocardiopsis oceani]